MDVRSKKMVLVLNRHWMPIEIVTHKDAFRLMCKGHALALDTCETYTTHTMQSWIDIHSTDKYTHCNTVSLEVPIPEIIVLTLYEKMPKRSISFSKKNLLIRDNYMCAYCQCEVTEENATTDHIIPQALGGETSWTNCVIACKACNNEKDCQLPEGKFKLKKKPTEPSHTNPIFHLNQSLKHGKAIMPKSWRQALFHGK